MASNIKFFIDLPQNLSLVSPPLAVELLKQAKMAQIMAKGFFMRVGVPTLPIWGTPLLVGMFILFDEGKIDKKEIKTMATLGFLSLVIFSGAIFYTNRRRVAILEKLITDLTKIANQPS
jgi:hypothetical protein